MQEKIAAKKGNSSRDSFSVGDRVRIRSHLDGRWDKRGTIVEARSSGTSSPPASFVIKTDGGTELVRHKSYLKYDITHEGLDLTADEIGLSATDKNVQKPVPAVLTFDRARLRERKPRE